MSDIAVGQWIVIADNYGHYYSAKVDRVTAQTVLHSPSRWSSRQGRSAREKIKFVGSEGAATHLAHKLRTSAGNFESDKRAASIRFHNRNAELIAATLEADKLPEPA